ncbi:MAG: DNA repair exonuclease [Isosphaeraceae bacterium]|nr:DNA repair exonuclease [Isosphaeraceae bacterium]
MFKFLHAADIHLDSPQKGLDRYEGAPVEECRRATRQALENLVRLAIEERVAFVLIAGDLYDGKWTDYNTGLYLTRQMARLREAGIKVYVIQGNHDAENKMTRSLSWPENVVLLSTQGPQTLTLDEWSVALHGQGYATAAVTANLVDRYPGAIPGLFNIGLLHTCAGGYEDHARYAPCSLGEMRAKGYDYWALGHIHKREELLREPWIVFPGNLQGRHARETGAKGASLVTVDDSGQATVEHQALDVLRWEVCRVDASDAPDGDVVLERFDGQLKGLLAAGDDRLLALRVEVVGACAAHGRLLADWPRWTGEVRRAAIEASNGRAWVEKVQPRTRPPGLADLDAASDGPLAELRGLIDELRQDENRLKQLGEKALDDLKKKLPTELMEGLDGPDRLKELLDQVGPLLLNRLNAGY